MSSNLEGSLYLDKLRQTVKHAWTKQCNNVGGASLAFRNSSTTKECWSINLLKHKESKLCSKCHSLSEINFQTMLNPFRNPILSSLKMLHATENQFWQALKFSLTQTNIFNSERMFPQFFISFLLPGLY